MEMAKCHGPYRWGEWFTQTNTNALPSSWCIRLNLWGMCWFCCYMQKALNRYLSYLLTSPHCKLCCWTPARCAAPCSLLLALVHLSHDFMPVSSRNYQKPPDPRCLISCDISTYLVSLLRFHCRHPVGDPLNTTYSFWSVHRFLRIKTYHRGHFQPFFLSQGFGSQWFPLLYHGLWHVFFFAKSLV